MDRLLAELAALIRSTGWTDDKQKQWLSKHNAMSWDDCSEAVLRKAIKRLRTYDSMFSGKRIDTPPLSVDNEDSETIDALRVYEGQ